MRRSRASVFHACCKWISAPSRQSVAVRASLHVEQELPSSLIPVDHKAISCVFPLNRNSARWLTGQAPEESATSSWDAGHPPVDEQQKERGQLKAANRENETTPFLTRETNTREMFHAKAREVEQRLAEEGKREDDMTVPKPKVASGMIEEAEGTSVWALAVKVTVKCPGDRTNGSYSLLEYEVAPGDGCQTHTHLQEDETWYMLEGEMEWRLRDEEFQAKKGCYIHLPSGIPHSFHNKSGKLARMLVSCLPAGLEKYFLEIGVPVDPNPDAKRPAMSEKDTLEAINAGKKYGVTFA